jgi:7-cyano-7-deazaguanine synthase
MSYSNTLEEKALVVLSGGQDSMTCLYWAISTWGRSNIETLTFNYGQKHRIELEAARKVCATASVNFDLVNIPNLLRSSSPLVNSTSKLEQHGSLEGFSKGVQNTFVPGRNVLFLTLAANIAMSKSCKHLVMGLCEEDFGGYYDCRDDFVEAMQTALNQGFFGDDEGFEIHTPLMFFDKKEIVEFAAHLEEPLSKECFNALAWSHTCYEGVFPPCGTCHACHLRARGFHEAGIEDPLLLRAHSLRPV